MLARLVKCLVGLLVVVGLMFPLEWAVAAPQARVDTPTLEISGVDSGAGGAIFSIVLRNGGTALNDVTVSGMIPAGSSYETSWTGDGPGSNQGQASDTRVSWFVPTLDANAVAGPFRFRVGASTGSNLTSQATAIWQSPTPGSVTSGVTGVQVASQPTIARVEISIDRQSSSVAIVTLVVRNLTSTDLGLLSVYGSIPPGATVLSSWTGVGLEHPGAVTPDQREIAWFNSTVPKDGIQGPFHYQLRFDPESGATVGARATWARPLPGAVSAPAVWLAEPTTAPPSSVTAPEIAVDGGRFFKQTNGLGPGFDAGFAVVDGGEDVNGRPITFWSAYQQFGGSTILGYPISRRFTFSAGDSFVYQAFQKGLLQWNPAEQRAVLANLSDLVSAAGLDPALERLGYAPAEQDSSGGDFARARQERLGWLDVPSYQDLKDAYLAIPGHETLLGLPAAHPRSYGWIRVLRLQRGALASYNNGPVVWTSLGDDAKKLGFFHGDAGRPQTLAESSRLEPVVQAAPEAGPAIPYKYRELYTEVKANCSLTMLRGTVKDVQGNGVNGLLVRSWNAEGNEYFSLTGYKLDPGQWERFIDYGIKPSLWNVQVVDPNTKQPFSPISRVRFTDQCGEGGVQEIWIHYRANY